MLHVEWQFCKRCQERELDPEDVDGLCPMCSTYGDELDELAGIKPEPVVMVRMSRKLEMLFY